MAVGARTETGIPIPASGSASTWLWRRRCNSRRRPARTGSPSRPLLWLGSAGASRASDPRHRKAVLKTEHRTSPPAPPRRVAAAVRMYPAPPLHPFRLVGARVDHLSQRHEVAGALRQHRLSNAHVLPAVNDLHAELIARSSRRVVLAQQVGLHHERDVLHPFALQPSGPS